MNMFSKKKEEQMEESNGSILQIKKRTNVLLNSILMILSFISILPFIFVIVISFTDEDSLSSNGYRLFPEKWSTDAYEYLLRTGEQLLKSYGVTITITVFGTIIVLAFISTYAYAISRKSFEYKGFFTKFAFIPMLFNGGMVSTYLVMVRMLGMKNSLLALILPLAMNTWYMMILRTFFKTSVPESIIESAKIDGASELKTFIRIVLPISLPGMATIALFLTLGYWNDWFNAMLYIDKESLIPLQYLLIRIETSMEFLVDNASKLGTASVEAAAEMPSKTAKMAMVVLATAPIIMAYPFFQKYFVQGLTVGSIKE